MEQFRLLLLDIWREACRHIEITESAETTAKLLSTKMPLGRVLVLRLESQHRWLATVAAAPAPTTSWESLRPIALADEGLEQLARWARTGRVLHRAEGRRATGNLSLVLPDGCEESALAIPLKSGGSFSGVLLLLAQQRHDFDEHHKRLAHELQEPFSVALENDRRLHEMVALREAAEAEKRSLLTKLGREQNTETIVGEESGLRLVMSRVELVARSDVPALILGETGTGKELVARAIHQRSERAQGPFIRVNCGAIPPELIDSQLFGHEKGSFTGASESRQGWFERADGGTLFLDEIGELPLDAQVRFLRVLQDGYVERVGAQQPAHVDVRVVAATHRDLASMVREGRFREDLWYRIAVFPILLPPLRERVDDIPQLARHFAARAAKRFGLASVDPTPENVFLLQGYDWPGNIRELGAVIDRAAILGDGQTLEVATALGMNAPPPTRSRTPTATAGTAANANAAAILPLHEAMRRHIEVALRATSGKIEGSRGAAKLLEINPHTLRARMRKLGIDWDSFRSQ